MALVHPRSLERWEEWRRSRRRVAGIGRVMPGRRAKRSRREQPSGYVLHSREGEGPARLLFGIDTAEEARRSGMLEALPYLHGSIHVLAPAGLVLDEPASGQWERRHLEAAGPVLGALGITSVLTLGQHRRTGRALHAWARKAGIPGAVLQHDLLTPYTAPLPAETTVLAWTEADGRFHAAGRDDIETRVVGSQRLWRAGHDAAPAVGELDAQPVFLGQLAQLELPRHVTLRAAHSYCREAGALYRPGPGEEDRLSRAAHALLRRRGIPLQDPATPLDASPRPVAAVLSVDLLEAAVRGWPAWAHAPGAPSWIPEQWERYGMRRLGQEPTPAPPVGADEPARLIAQILEGGA